MSLLDIDDTHFLRRIELSTEWQELHLPLSTFLASDNSPLDPSRVGDLQFFLAPAQPFDVWIDDRRLLPSPKLTLPVPHLPQLTLPNLNSPGT